MREVSELVRVVVRPTVTWGLVAGQIRLAALWALGYADAKDAAAMLGPFTMMAATFYFKSRDEERHAREDGHERETTPHASLVVGAK